MKSVFTVTCSADDNYGYIPEIKGSLLIPSADIDDDEWTEVGRVEACVLRLDEAREDGVHTYYDVADQDALCAHVYTAVLDLTTGSFRDFVEIGIGGGNVLIVRAMQILPEYRGQNLGFFLLEETMRTFQGGCGVIVIEPHPLRAAALDLEELNSDWAKRMEWQNLATTETAYKKGAKRLREHWSRLGFEPVPRTKQRFFYRVPGFCYPRAVVDDGLVEILEPLKTAASG